MSIILLIVGVLLFFGLVVAHEWGHFIMARRGDVTVEEFGIGFPPRLFKKRTKGGWLFTINLLPLGGFVKLKGEHDVDSEPHSLGAASIGTKTKIMAAGVVMNLIVAYVLFVILALVGMPQLIDGQFMVKHDAVYLQHAQKYVAADSIEHGSPADRAGLQRDDVILAFGDPSHPIPFTTVDELPKLTKQFAGKQALIRYRHGDQGKVHERLVTLRSSVEVAVAKASGKQIGYLGVGAYQGQHGADVVRSTWSAPIVAVGVIKQFTLLTLQGLGKAIVGLGSIIAGGVSGNTVARQAGQTAASSQVSGPVGIFFVFKYGSALGFRYVLLIVAILSLTLAIMNILPVPALDGGRLWLMLITRAIRKPLSPRKEELINAAGFAFLMCLILLVTIVDVRRFF
jgi:regulator of sigma E protease